MDGIAGVVEEAMKLLPEIISLLPAGAASPPALECSPLAQPPPLGQQSFSELLRIQFIFNRGLRKDSKLVIADSRRH